MREKIFFKNILPIFMVFINLALSVSVVFLMRYVQNLLNSDVKINLVEIVTQNKDAITSRLMMNVNSLDITANKLSDRLKAEESSGKLKTQDLIEQYAKENNTDDLFTANRDGMALFDGGRKLDISGRHYFRLAIDGIPNISDKLISRINGDEVFVISVPLPRYSTIEFLGIVLKASDCAEGFFNSLCFACVMPARLFEAEAVSEA